MINKITKRFDNIDLIANHYGFEKMKTPTSHQEGDIFLNPEQKISILKQYQNKYPKKKNKISMLYNKQPILTNKRLKNLNSRSVKNFNFDIIGTTNSVAEATIIHTAIVVLGDEGFKDVFVNINSFGNRESVSNYRNELFNYYKNRNEELHPKCRNVHKKNVFDLLLCKHKECQILKKSAPRSIYYLSDISRKHLKDTIEYLESMNIIYNIDDLLISPSNHFSKIVFEIKHKDDKSGDDILLGQGGRYDELARKITRKKKISAVGISLEFNKRKTTKSSNDKNKILIGEVPKFYFIQFGLEAKLKSLAIIEKIRDKKISVRQDLHIDKFTEQIEIAKQIGVPYALILGQEEVAKDTIIVKDLRRVTQKTIKIDNLLPYLKQLN